MIYIIYEHLSTKLVIKFSLPLTLLADVSFNFLFGLITCYSLLHKYFKDYTDNKILINLISSIKNIILVAI